MPLIARNKKTGEQIDISQYQKGQARQALRGLAVGCPYCENDMVVVSGLIRINHFRHKAGKCIYGYHPETLEHAGSKILFRKQIKLWWPEYQADQVTVEIEKAIESAGRIADVYIDFGDGRPGDIHEIQLARIDLNELEKRTADYRQAGHAVYWWFGPANSEREEIAAWSYSQYEGLLRLDFRREFVTEVLGEHTIT